MPMIVETAIAALAKRDSEPFIQLYLAVLQYNELATRLDDAKPKLVLAASCGLEPGRIIDYKPLLDGAIELASHKPEACLIWQRNEASASTYRWPRF